MFDSNFKERITLTSLMPPNEELNIPGIIAMSIKDISEFTYQNPGIYNFSIIKGNTFDLTFVYKDDNSVPIDLTGYTVTGYAINIKNTALSFNLKPEITSPTEGEIKIHLSVIDTLNIASLYIHDQYKYNINLIYNNTNINIMTGVINVCQ